MQKITPFFWFDSQAEEAANFYVSVFSKYSPDSKIGNIVRYPEVAQEVSGKPAGSVMTVAFTLSGMEFAALNGGPEFKFSMATSFVIDCKNQEEVDYFWDKLGDGGEKGPCGWINKDKFGMTWQVVPTALEEYLSDPDKEKRERVMKAMLEMDKIKIDDLKKAYDGK